MKKQRVVRIVCSVLLLCTICSPQVQSQGQRRGPQEPRYGCLLSNELLIMNDDENMTVPFGLRNGRQGDYSPFQLSPGKREVYRNTTEIMVRTDNGNSVKYLLEYGKRYKIYWHQPLHRWDVSTAIEKHASGSGTCN